MKKTSTFHAEKRAHTILTVFFAVLAVAYLYPILLVLINSFKSNAAINLDTFALPTRDVHGLAELYQGHDLR